MKEACIAIDLGGGSGRVMAGIINGNRLTLDCVHRFTNRQVRMSGHIYWDIPALFDEIKTGLKMAVEKGYRLRSIGVDTWGVDFGLIDTTGEMVGNAGCYRDPFTDKLPQSFFENGNSREEIYRSTGIQTLAINTLFQLYGRSKAEDPKLKTAKHLLFTPDLISFLLSGETGNEYTIASTSQMLDARSRTWNDGIIEAAGVDRSLFGKILMPGDSRGSLLPEIAKEIGVDYPVEIIAVASHDTQSAIYALPQADKNVCRAFLSSGTWSLLGAEIDEPILSQDACKAGFSNEGGAGNKICFLQNITGLWILQQLIALWKHRGETTDYGFLIDEAEKSEITSVFDVDDPAFHSPLNMEQAIADYCRNHRLTIPQSQGDFTRATLLSLAARYKTGIEELNRFLPRPVEQLNIIGGGSQNRLLNHLTEIATGIPVVAGPVEATAIGNILLQAEAVGIISSRYDVTIRP